MPRDAKPRELDPLLTTEEVAAYFGYDPHTIKRWRAIDKEGSAKDGPRGPKPIKLPGGGVRYFQSEVQAFVDSLRESA